MSIFLKEPDYVFGCLGFATTPAWRRGVVRLGAGLSALATVLAVVLLALRYSTPSLIGQMMFLVAGSWLITLGLFRLFWTGAMWLFDQIGDAFTNAAPGLTTPIRCVYLAYWYFFEVFFTLGFLVQLGYALLLPFGLVQPL
jgi:hypothetical protein